MESTAEKPTYKKLDPSLQRVSLNLDRKLWRKYRALMVVRGETMTSRVEILIRRDIDDLKSSNAAS